jgi:hypothetical protein
VQDDVELYVSERDASVVLRAAARVRKLPDGGRNARRLESIRRRLGWVRAKPRPSERRPVSLHRPVLGSCRTQRQDSPLRSVRASTDVTDWPSAMRTMPCAPVCARCAIRLPP